MDLLPIKFRHQTFQKEDNLTDLLVQKTNVSVHLDVRILTRKMLLGKDYYRQIQFLNGGIFN
jgi:hypothetical protein